VNKSRRIGWAEYVARLRREEACIQGLGGETCGKEPLGGPRLRWENNIKVNLKEVGYGGMYLIDLAQDRAR